VPRAVFAGGRAVAPALVPLPTERLANAPVLPGSPQIMPPASKPMVVAVASAVHTLARILTPHQTRAAARTLILRPNRAAMAQAGSGTTFAQARSVFAARVGSSASRAKARAYARASRGRTHLAAATSTRTRLH